MNTVVQLWEQFWGDVYSPVGNAAFVTIGVIIILAGLIVIAESGSDCRKALARKGTTDEFKRDIHKRLLGGFRLAIYLFLVGFLLIMIRAYTWVIFVFALIAGILILAGWFFWWLVKNISFAFQNITYK